VLLVGTHALIRSALASLIEEWQDIEVVDSINPNADAIAITAQEHPDVILLHIDANEDDDAALRYLSALREEGENRRVLVVTGEHNAEEQLQPVLIGALGVVHEDQAPSVLERAIRRVHAGEVWLERAMTAEALSRLSGWRHAPESGSVQARLDSLSGREQDVVDLVCEGLQNREIGKRLSISEATVRHHLTSIFEKLDLENRLELVIFACRNKRVYRREADWSYGTGDSLDGVERSGVHR
jgi:DNA-binding NarL/FixJ family response regulator